MASVVAMPSVSCFRIASPSTVCVARFGVRLTPVMRVKSVRLSSSRNISNFSSIVEKVTEASAKRFRVTGTGKIVRRRARKQHLLVKKNAKRRNRLSKMVQVDKSDYDNVIGALPYLKVNRKAT
ncbi:hypothetical protein QQ045_031395 [Rhodiola kirilowii]